MTPQQIKANAPEGATHYSKDSVFPGSYYYFKVVGEDVYIWQLGKMFAKTIRRFSEYSSLSPL